MPIKTLGRRLDSAPLLPVQTISIIKSEFQIVHAHKLVCINAELRARFVCNLKHNGIIFRHQMEDALPFFDAASVVYIVFQLELKLVTPERLAFSLISNFPRRTKF